MANISTDSCRCRGLPPSREQTWHPLLPHPALLVRVELYQAVEKRPPVIKGLHADALVQAVNVACVRVQEESADPISGDSYRVQKLGIGFRISGVRGVGLKLSIAGLRVALFRRNTRAVHGVIS